jgi:hypothetical protein
VARIYYGSFLSTQNIEYRVELWDGPTGTSAPVAASTYAARVTAAGGYQEGASCLLEKLTALEDATELTLAGNGFSIERQGQGNTYYENYIRPSRVSTNWLMPNDTVRNAFINIANSEESKYAIVVYRGGSLFYVGRVVADQADYLRESINGAPVFDLVAVDSLNLIEGFNVSPDWFTDGFATGLEIIRKCLEYCGLDDYWTALGSVNYLRDGVTMYDTAQASYKGLANTRFNVLSFYNSFDPFSDVKFINTTDPFEATTDIDLLTGKEAIEQILSIYGARIILESGSFYILPSDAYSSVNITTRNYNAAGAYQNTTSSLHAVDLGANNRPQWEAKPSLSYQPPVRAVDVIEDRQNAIFVLRTEPDNNSIELSIVNKTIEASKPTRVRMLCKWFDDSFVALSTSSAKRYQRYLFNYRIYVTNGSTGIRQYSPNLNAYFTPLTTALYMQQELTVTNTRNSYNTHALDFVLPPIPTGFTQLYVDYYIEAEEGFFVAPNNWASNMSYPINFWGTITAAQPYSTQEDPDFSRTTKQTVSVTGAASGNSQLIKVAPAYYDDEGLYGFGSVYVYNGSSWVVSSDWYSGFASAIHSNLGEIIGKRIAGTYNKFVQVIQGTWFDAGTLTAIKSLNFDSTKWLFNGGTFNPRAESWNGEWLGLAPDYTLATGGGTTEYNPRTGERIIKDRLNYHEFAITKLNLETSAVQDRVLEYLVNQADGAPTTQPTLNTRWEVMLQYTDSDSTLAWHLQEHNGSVVYTAGTHTITNGYELIICNTADGNVTVNLPNATESKGKKYYFIKTANPHVITISGGAYNINGSSATTINSLYGSKTIISDGAQWYIISSV